MKYDLIEKTNKTDFKRGDDDTVTKYFLLRGNFVKHPSIKCPKVFRKKFCIFATKYLLLLHDTISTFYVQQQSASTVGIWIANYSNDWKQFDCRMVPLFTPPFGYWTLLCWQPKINDFSLIFSQNLPVLTRKSTTEYNWTAPTQNNCEQPLD